MVITIFYVSVVFALSALIVFLMGETSRLFLWFWLGNVIRLFGLILAGLIAGNFFAGGLGFLEAILESIETLFATEDATTFTILVIGGIALHITWKRGRPAR